MTDKQLEASRIVEAPPDKIFALLITPDRHPELDASGTVRGSRTHHPLSAVGDVFEMEMHGEDMGDYVVDNHVVTFEPDREIAWTIEGTIRPPLQHVYGYRLEPADGGTLVTSYCDWSNLREDYRPFLTFPIVPESALKGTLGILDRTVRRRASAGSGRDGA